VRRLLTLAIALTTVITACADDRDAKRAPTKAHVVIAETDIEDAGARRLRITGDWLAAGEGAMWLSGTDAIYRLDPATGRRQATIDLPAGPCEATDTGFGAIWTATCNDLGLVRIDPATNRVSGRVKLPIPQSLDGEGSIGAGAGGVWLVVDARGCTACRVARIDPWTLRVTARVAVREGSAAVRAGEGSVWVTNPDHDMVQQIDPAALEVARTIGTGPAPRFLDVGEGAAWTLNQLDGSVTRIDAATGKSMEIEAGVAGEGGDLTVGGGSVWARGSRWLLTRIDPRSNEVTARYGPESGSGAVIVGSGAIWISAHDIHAVWRLPLDQR
jgi:hypothetical protein